MKYTSLHEAFTCDSGARGEQFEEKNVPGYLVVSDSLFLDSMAYNVTKLSSLHRSGHNLHVVQW